MKTKFVLTGILGIALLAMAAPHTWTFKQGGTFEEIFFIRHGKSCNPQRRTNNIFQSQTFHRMTKLSLPK